MVDDTKNVFEGKKFNKGIVAEDEVISKGLNGKRTI